MILSLEGVSFTYPGRRGVEDLARQVERSGSLIALAGQNGSGKTTLLKLIARVLSPDRGSILFGDVRASDWPAKEYAKRVGYLPQGAESVFPMRAIDVVVSGRAQYLRRFEWESQADYEKAMSALVRCDAGHLADRYLDEMSGGERKRVFLARVLVGSPEMMLLDEPLGALDIAHVQQFSKLLRSIVDETNATVIFASHDLNWAAAYCDRMIVMDQGRIVMDDVPSRIMQPDVVKRFFGYDAQSIERNGRSWLVPQ